MSYDIVKLQDQLILSEQSFCLDIASWEKYPNSVLLNWQYTKFDRSNKNSIPEVPGVYAFFIKPGIANFSENAYLIYIGKAGDRSANNLRKRFNQYLIGKKGDKRPKFNRVLKKWDNYIFFCFATITDNHVDLDKLEKELNDALIPPYNESDFSPTVRKIVKVLR